jgi:hypothetical protein
VVNEGESEVEYTITASSGWEAEAVGLESARLAARTAIAEGYGPEVKIRTGGDVVLVARVSAHTGNVEFVGIQGKHLW